MNAGDTTGERPATPRRAASLLRFPSPLRFRAAALGVALGLAGTSACGGPERAPREPNTADTAPPSPAAPPVGTGPSPEPARPVPTDRLPAAVTGTFDETQDACAEPLTFARLVVRPDTLRFYYGYATVDAVERRDGAYTVAATLFQQEGVIEVVPEAITYRLAPRAQGDSLSFVADLADRVTTPALLVRCSPR